MTKLVTIGIPVYKCFTYLPQALTSVQVQDYPDIELIVSDNGMNGSKVPEFVDQWYHRPYRFRQNPSTVDQSTHYTQLLNEASGEYFVPLGDDDEITPNFVSDLVQLLDRYSQASVAIPKQETIDEAGRILRSSADNVPEIISGEDLIRGWCLGTYKFQTFSTVLLRTKEAIKCGGYPVIPTGNGVDDLLMIKLSLNNFFALSSKCTFRKREYEASLGFSCEYGELIKAYKEFFRHMKSDPMIQDFAKTHPDQWGEMKSLIVKMVWQTYLSRWKDMYRYRLPPLKWAWSAYAMPYIPAYYLAVTKILIDVAKSALLSRVKKELPWAYRIYRGLK